MEKCSQRPYGLDGLYAYKDDGQEGLESHYQLEINGAHELFRGHFPSFKIVPGVCLLQMLETCLADRLGCPVEWVDIPNCKFVAPVLPTQDNRLDLYFELPREGSVKARMLCGGEVVANMKIHYRVCDL